MVISFFYLLLKLVVSHPYNWFWNQILWFIASTINHLLSVSVSLDHRVRLFITDYFLSKSFCSMCTLWIFLFLLVKWMLTDYIDMYTFLTYIRVIFNFVSECVNLSICIINRYYDIYFIYLFKNYVILHYTCYFTV